MELGRLLSVVVLGVSLAASAHAREPRQFKEPYRDGFVIALWDPGISDRKLAEIVGRVAATGAKFVQIPIFGCQSGINSSDVGSCEVQPRDFARRIAFEVLVQGMRVSFLPIVATPKWDWRGNFEPTDLDAWFKSYTKWMEGVAQDAMAYGSSELVVGTEFKLLFRKTEHWKKFLRHMREVFPGPLVMTANWDEIDYGFWDEADAIGVSAYFPLSNDRIPSQADLDAAWIGHRQKLKSLTDRWSRPLHMTEVGYTSTTTAAASPWHTPQDAPSDFALQAKCFEAFARAWHDQRWLVRAGVWAVTDSAQPAWDRSADPLGKTAEGPLRWFVEARSRLTAF